MSTPTAGARTLGKTGPARDWPSAVVRALLILFCAGAAACLPDLGAPMPVGSDGAAETGHRDGGFADGGSQITPDGGSSNTAATCDDSPPSREVSVNVWGENFTYYFTPAGDDINTLYVPANALVHFSIAGSLNEEQHIFQVVIPGCQTPQTGGGTQDAPATLDWKAPNTPGTFKDGGKCVNHPGMEFDIVVTP